MKINDVNYYNSTIEGIVINKIKNSQLLLSEIETKFNNEEDNDIVTEFAFSSMKFDEKYNFINNDNKVYSNVKKIFNAEISFIEFSKNISNLLFDSSNEAKRFDGDIFVIYFKNCIVFGENVVDAIGVFKNEKLDYFINTKFDGNNVFELSTNQAINMSKIDRGCLIFNIEEEKGYSILALDNRNKTNNSYWFEDFLKVKQRDDEYFHTQETLAVYKDFITKQLPTEFEVSKADQADFLNKSINFFKEKEKFDFEEFTNEVLEDKNVIESFSNFKSDYENDMQVSISEDFAINEAAVKKQSRGFKSVIKLDKNFHIYVHGDRKMIETGQDEKGKYYRLYFEEEK